MSAAKKCDICGHFYNNYGYKAMDKKNSIPNTIELWSMGYRCGESYIFTVSNCCPDYMTVILQTITNLSPIKVKSENETK